MSIQPEGKSCSDLDSNVISFSFLITFIEPPGASHGGLNEPSPQLQADRPQSVKVYGRIQCLFSMTLLPGPGAHKVPHVAVDLRVGRAGRGECAGRDAGRGQGLTLVHVSAQRKRFVWDRGCIYG